MAASMMTTPGSDIGRAGDRIHGRHFYERLGTIRHGPFADAWLEADQIEEGRSTYLEALSRLVQEGRRQRAIVDGHLEGDEIAA